MKISNDMRDIQAAWACRVAACFFVGWQHGYGVTPDLMLFQPLSGPLQGSTLAIPADHVSPYRVSARVAEALNALKAAA